MKRMESVQFFTSWKKFGSKEESPSGGIYNSHTRRSQETKSMIFSFASAWVIFNGYSIPDVKKLTRNAVGELFNSQLGCLTICRKANWMSAKPMAEVSPQKCGKTMKIFLRSRMLTNSQNSSIWA